MTLLAALPRLTSIWRGFYFGPALSSDRLEIEYGKNNVMVISPDGKTEFLQKLDNEKVTNTDTAQQQTADKLPKNATKKQMRQLSSPPNTDR